MSTHWIEGFGKHVVEDPNISRFDETLGYFVFETTLYGSFNLANNLDN